MGKGRLDAAAIHCISEVLDKDFAPTTKGIRRGTQGNSHIALWPTAFLWSAVSKAVSLVKEDQLSLKLCLTCEYELDTAC